MNYMLRTHRIATILSFTGLISTLVLSSSNALAQFQRIPGVEPQLRGVEATISGKIYLSDLPPVLDSAKCENIAASLSKLVKNPNYSNNPSGGIYPEYIYKNVTSTTASGDIKRGYCDYTLKFLGLTGDYQLSAGADYQNLLGNPNGCRVDSSPMGWNNPISSFDENRDMKLSRGCLR
jgi:hypothetical protein